jgi:tetraacyldisaccharide 4'-kinase
MKMLRILAFPLAPLYGAVVRARNLAFDNHPERAARAGLPVISIGNLSLGGTGKTPVTLFLAEGLQKLGWSSVVLSRGYGGRRRVDPMTVDWPTSPLLAGDEPVLMARRLGPGRVVVARRRIEGAQLVHSFVPKPRCLLLDDGFQHRALHRDLDLLLLDGVKRWGNGRMVPLGDLREPMSSAARAHALIITRAARAPMAEIRSWWDQHGSRGPVFGVDFAISALRNWTTGERLLLPDTLGRSFLAFCALGNPQAFLADLMVAGVRWVADRTFHDHHRVTPRELQLIEQQATESGAEALVCTEKDAVKLDQSHRAVLNLPLYVAEQSLLGGEELLTWVVARLETFSTEPPPATMEAPPA